jgi:hypothetical protein
MPRERTIDDLAFLRDTALQKAARLERQLKDEPRYYQAQTKYRIRLARERARQLEKEIEAMRSDEYVPQSGNAWPWRAWVTLDLEGKRYSRGSVIPDDVIERSANCARLISGGYVRRLPESKPKQPAPEQEKQKATAVALLGDHIAVCRTELRRIAHERNIDLRTAIDLLPEGMYARAQKQYADHPPDGFVMTAAWGQPATRQASGEGVRGRRCIEGFIEYLISGERKDAAA